MSSFTSVLGLRLAIFTAPVSREMFVGNWPRTLLVRCHRTYPQFRKASTTPTGPTVIQPAPVLLLVRQGRIREALEVFAKDPDSAQHRAGTCALIRALGQDDIETSTQVYRHYTNKFTPDGEILEVLLGMLLVKATTHTQKWRERE